MYFLVVKSHICSHVMLNSNRSIANNFPLNTHLAGLHTHKKCKHQVYTKHSQVVEFWAVKFIYMSLQSALKVP